MGVELMTKFGHALGATFVFCLTTVQILQATSQDTAEAVLCYTQA